MINSPKQYPRLGSENCFLTLPVIVFREDCRDGSLGLGLRFCYLRFDGGAFDTVSGKGFGDELNQTFHRGLLVPQSSEPVSDGKAAPAFAI